MGAGLCRGDVHRGSHAVRRAYLRSLRSQKQPCSPIRIRRYPPRFIIVALGVLLHNHRLHEWEVCIWQSLCVSKESILRVQVHLGVLIVSRTGSSCDG